MSSKTRTPRLRNQKIHPGKSLFSDKEHAIIREELADANSHKRNIPIFQEMIQKYNELRDLRINPFQMLSVYNARYQSMTANASISGQTIQEERMIESIIQDYAERLDFASILEILVPIAKAVKIKREKRALLWLAGEILQTIGNNSSLKESLAVRAIIVSSFTHAMAIMDRISRFLRGEEPFSPIVPKILDGSWTKENWKALLVNTIDLESDFTTAMSSDLMALFNEISRPFGLRFHRVIRYAFAMKDKQKRSILLPGESSAQENDRLDEETSNRLMESLLRDLSPVRRVEFAKDAIQSIQSAAFGEIDKNQLSMHLNAVAYCFLSPIPISPFLAQLYRISGENAEQINPSDEKELIIDLKGSPENPLLYLRYVELLEQKGEFLPAAQVCDCLREIAPDLSDELNAKINQLRQRAGEEAAKKSQPAADSPETTPESSGSKLIITP